MSSNFEHVVRQMIEKYDMESLSDSVGWPAVREIRRKLENRTIAPEDAVDEFLGLRGSYRSQANDREFKKTMLRLMK